MQTYLVANTRIAFSFIANAKFEAIFEKYKVFDRAKSDLFFKSVMVDSIPFTVNEKTINGPNYYLNIDDDLYQYALVENNVLIGTIKCHKNNLYEIFVLKGQNAYYVEYIMLQCGLARFFTTHYQALFIHSSCISYHDKAIMFSAPSGTGKSTHSRLWHQYLKAEYINDDKNFIFLEDDKLYVYGSPISGKHELDNNIKNELVGLIFLKQAKENKIRRLSKMEAFMKLMNQIQRPDEVAMLESINPIIDKIVAFPCYELECNISYEAVKLAHDAYFEGEKL